MRQRTIKKPVRLEGVALHSGAYSRIEIRPAREGSGIFFTKGNKRIPALASSVSDTSRGTSLSGVISVVEHLLAAAYGLGLDNLEIIMDESEPPALDGSSAGYVAAFRSAGFLDQSAPKKMIRHSAKIELSSGESRLTFLPTGGFVVQATIDYPHSHVGVQTASFDESRDSFEGDIAPCRTFGLLSEVEDLKKKGLALGADAENAIAITQTGFSSRLRFPNELARHKILDIIGDIALAGGRVTGTIISYRAGHRLNTELARRLFNAAS